MPPLALPPIATRASKEARGLIGYDPVAMPRITHSDAIVRAARLELVVVIFIPSGVKLTTKYGSSIRR